MGDKLKLALASLILMLLVCQAEAIARAPTPYCSSKTIYKQFPLSAEEILVHDMSDTFSGYNLNITLASKNPWASITPKWQILDRRNAYFPNIISHYVQPKDNSVGRDSFLLYKDFTGSVMLSYGIIRDKGSLPVVNATAIVTTDKNIVCFDGALFLDHGLAIVDCAKTGSSIFSKYTNLFYIIDLTDHSLKKIVPNDLYIGFTSITRRKLMKFSHPEAGGFTYLLRTYFSDGVDERNSDNTYMEIFTVPIEDPTAIEPLRVIDRTFLNLNTLRIMDAQIYMDDIFLLDYDTGLLRLDILKSQRVVITATYVDYGFEKFGVYSDDLQDEVIIALSNKHSIYEIDWHLPRYPALINKYSLMENSKVKQLFINDQYVIVQSTADAYNSTKPKFEVDYTWIFTKGSRTYTNAYHVINHNSSTVEVEFDRANNHIYIADQKGLTLRVISEASLVMHYSNQSWFGNKEDLVIYADSTDFNSNETFRCQERITALFISKQNQTIFPSGLDITDVYSVNYPNPLEISLEDYFLGPDIHYQVQDHKGEGLPDSWVNKINRTTIKMNPAPRPGDITYFHTDVIPELGHEVVIYYYEDSSNTTHVAECIHMWDKADMDCNVRNSYNHSSRLRSFTSTIFRDDDGWQYFYSLVLEGDNKRLRIYDYMKQKLIAQLVYSGDFDAEITSIASSNGFIYVLRKYVKQIDVYSLRKCAEFGGCAPDFIINAETMKGLGVNYFSPQAIVTDNTHPEVIFIKCLGSLIILDIDNKQKLHVLDQIISPPTDMRNYQVAVSKERLVIVAYPNLVYEYSLQHIYTYNMVVLTKTLPTYGYNIQPNADVEFSDYDSMVYVNAVDPKKNISVIIVYRTGHAASRTCYAIIELDKLYSRPGFEVEVSGYFVDFLTIIAGNEFKVYRVFGRPFLTIHEAIKDFSFKVQAFNSLASETTKEINVTVVNNVDFITPTIIFNQTMSSLKADTKGNYEWEDRQWFDGNVIHYNYSCDECNQRQNPKVKIREHIDNFNDFHIGANHYVETVSGGLSVLGDLFRFKPNGSIYAINNLPDQRYLEKCIKIAAADNELFAVTACQQLRTGVYLYITSFASYKGFTWGPYVSPATNVRSLQIVNDIMMLADTPANPEFKFEYGAIYLYRVSLNSESGNEMDELEIIDSNDFYGCAGWNEDYAFLSNAHLVYSGNVNAYRLYITESRFGFFVVDFVRAHATDNEITILSTTFINVKKLLEDNNLHMPNDASFLAITFVKSIINPHFDTENIIITTYGYDNFEITLYYDDEGHVRAPVLHRVYQRYSFYNAVNQVHARSGFIIIGYMIPPNMESLDFKKQYIALYDSIDYPHEFDKGYSERYMIGAVPLNTLTRAGFSLNTTYDFHSNGTRSGVLITIPTTNDTKMVGASVAHNLSLSLLEGYKTQTINIVAYNDFSTFKFTASITARNDNDTSENNTIIIIIIVFSCIIFVFIVFYIVNVVKRKRQPIEERESLLTENETLVRESVRQNVNDYQPPKARVSEQSDEEDDEDIQEQKPNPSIATTSQPQQNVREEREAPSVVRDVVEEPAVENQEIIVPAVEAASEQENNPPVPQPNDATGALSHADVGA